MTLVLWFFFFFFKKCIIYFCLWKWSRREIHFWWISDNWVNGSVCGLEGARFSIVLSSVNGFLVITLRYSKRFLKLESTNIPHSYQFSQCPHHYYFEFFKVISSYHFRLGKLDSSRVIGTYSWTFTYLAVQVLWLHFSIIEAQVQVLLYFTVA